MAKLVAMHDLLVACENRQMRLPVHASKEVAERDHWTCK
jgi:hypothetical protein